MPRRISHSPPPPWLLPLTLLALLDGALAAIPLVNFDVMGTVAIAGAFAGMDLFDNSSQISFDPKSTSIFARASDGGALSRIGTTNEGGEILAGCTLGDLVYLAGSFSTLNDTGASNIASYDPSSPSFAALAANGPNGPIHALYCDASNNKVWAGGSFSSPSPAVAVYDAKAKSWSGAPFGGLTGAAAEVLSITANSSASSLFFSGSFITSFVGNGSVINSTHNPNVPFSTGASAFSSSLVPIPLQNASIQAEPSSSDANFKSVQNILCPAGPDGPGDTWFAADGNTAVITARAFEFISATGVRLGNTFLNRSTTTFSVATIPDNAVRTLHYIDPASQQNVSCTQCPLSTDSSVLYQDFTFDGGELSLTGVQVTLSGWTGAGPGLHIFQLLSSGAFASALPAQNAQSCFAPAASNTSRTGDWTESDAPTNIAGTTQAVLLATVPVGTPQSQAPTITWQPYVSASGDYDVNLLVPGCNARGDCASRTSVKVTVFPGAGLDPTITTVDQSNQQDAVQRVYSGPIVPSSPNFVTTITMELADTPTGSGSGGNYELVADRVQLVLTSPNTTGSASGGGGNGTTGTKGSFGFFEWPLSASTVNAQTTLPNSTETAADDIGVSLFSALGGNSSLGASTQSAVRAVAHHSSGAIVVGGSFTLSSPATANIAVFKNGKLSAVANGGLNGNVTSFALDGDKLFVGGAFTDTTGKTTNGALSGVAVYDIAQDAWAPLQAGVDGTVASMNLVSGGVVQLAGNFTTLRDSASSTAGQSSPGLAMWNASDNAWVQPGGFVVGALAFVGNSTEKVGGQILAGAISTSLRFGASGLVTIKNGAGGAPAVTPLGVILDDGTTANASTSTARRRRSIPKRVGVSTWVSHFKPRALFSRQSTSSASDLPALPAPPAAIAPAVLAGAFYTNASSSEQLIVIGGNFTSGSARNVAFYNPTTGTLSPLAGVQPDGPVHALFVSGTQLFIGGAFTLAAPVSADGFAIYNLATGAWETGVQSLTAASGDSVLVRSISASSGHSSSIVVAGRFAGAGGLGCEGVCAIDAGSKQWNALGDGVKGEVAAVDYAGDNQDILVAAGSLALPGASTAANVLQYNFANTSWAVVGDAGSVPGPVTALAINDGSSSSVFAAGRTTDGASSFLAFFNGATWSTPSSTLLPSNISQLAMVPLQDTHAGNSVIQSDRMLLLSGSLEDSSFGSAAAALFDGASMVPYIMASEAGGQAGSVAGLFHSTSSFSFTQRHLLATGIVILISIAISAGVVFLLVLAGILWTLLARRDDALGAKFDAGDESDDDASAHHRPSSLLAHINAATRTTILGAAAGEEAQAGSPQHSPKEADPFAGPDASNYLRADTPSEAVAGMMAGEDEPGRAAHARYSFDGAGEGELPLSVGQELEVLDDRDHSWWYARDMRTGREGVVPAAYLY